MSVKDFQVLIKETMTAIHNGNNETVFINMILIAEAARNTKKRSWEAMKNWIINEGVNK